MTRLPICERLPDYVGLDVTGDWGDARSDQRDIRENAVQTATPVARYALCGSAALACSRRYHSPHRATSPGTATSHARDGLDNAHRQAFRDHGTRMQYLAQKAPAETNSRTNSSPSARIWPTCGATPRPFGVMGTV